MIGDYISENADHQIIKEPLEEPIQQPLPVQHQTLVLGFNNALYLITQVSCYELHEEIS